MHTLLTTLQRAGMAFVALAVFAGTAVHAQKIDPNNKYAAQEKAAFDKIVKNLDPYGNLFVYLDTKEAVIAVDKGIDSIKQIMKPLLGGGMPARDAMMADMGVKVVTKLYQDSGIRDIEGIGISSLRTGEKFYRNKTFIGYKPNPKGKMWEIFGKKSHDFAMLDLLPKETGFAMFGDFDPNVIWQWQFDLVQATGNPQIVAAHKAQLDQIKKQVDLKKLIGGMGGEFGLVITMDPESMVTIPIGQQPIKIPEPGIAFLIKVKDQGLQNFIQSKLVINNTPIPFQESVISGVKARNYLIPIPAPFLVSPTLAQVDDYLVIATSPKVLKSLLDSKGGKGLVNTAEFKTLAKDVPLQGNMFHYLSPIMGKTIINVQKGTLVNQSPEIRTMMETMLADAEQNISFSVGTLQLQELGMLGHGNSNVSGGKAVLIQAALVPLAVAGIGAGMLLPVMGKARGKARRVNCAGNLKQIGLGLLMYSGDHNGRFPDHLGQLHDEQILNAGKVYVCPEAGGATPHTAADLQAGRMGYLYYGKGLTDDNRDATITVIACDKPGNHGQWMNFLFIDGHVEGMNANSVQEACRKRGWKCSAVK